MMNVLTQESLCDSGKKTMMEADNALARKMRRVRKALLRFIVLEHMPLVISTAARVHQNLPGRVELDDLIRAGILGLFDAARTNDPRKKAIFHTYAKHRIKVAILDNVRLVIGRRETWVTGTSRAGGGTESTRVSFPRSTRRRSK